MFNGRSLTNIREFNNMSRKELAEKIGVSEQAIWQYENEYVSPKINIINKLKTILNVKASYFLTEDMLTKEIINNINPDYIAYRSKARSTLTRIKGEAMHIKFIDAFLKKIEKPIAYPKNTLIQLREESIRFMMNNEELDRIKQIKEIAKMARLAIDMPAESNINLLFLLEKSGAFILEKKIDESADAYSLWSEDNRPYIILGSTKGTTARRNFDLGHELGHLLLHYKQDFSILELKEYNELEKEADLFSSEFLLPEKEFLQDLKRIKGKSNPDSYIEIKEKWLVSIYAMGIRAFQTGEISYQQYRYFNMLINKYDYKKIEPLDKEIPLNTPTKIRSIINLLIDDQYETVSNILNAINVDITFLSQLTGIEEDFFKEHQKKEMKKFSVTELRIKSI